MSNCKVILSTDNNGLFHYQVTITVFDTIGTMYPYEGDITSLPHGEDYILTYQNLQSAQESRKNTITNVIPREKVYKDISHSNIKNFLFDVTGSSQQTYLNILYKLYSRGMPNPSIEFVF